MKNRAQLHGYDFTSLKFVAFPCFPVALSLPAVQVVISCGELLHMLTPVLGWVSLLLFLTFPLVLKTVFLPKFFPTAK